MSEGDFPRDEQGQLVMPTAVATEGDRIRASIAAGTYGAGQAPAVPAGGPIVTVAPASPLIEGNYGASGTDWAQADWSKNDDQLRQDLQLENLRSMAAQRKLALENAPISNALQNRLTEARTAAAGMHTRYQMAQDATALEHTHNFLTDMLSADAPAPGAVGHDDYVLKSLAANPAFAKTPGGQKLLATIAAGHDTGKTIADLAATIPENYNIKTIRAGGGKTSYITASPANSAADVSRELRVGYGLTPGQIENPVGLRVGTRSAGGLFTGDNNGDVVEMLHGDKKVYMSTKAFERYGGKYGPETAAARSAAVVAPSATPGQTPEAVKHLGTYNPTTGNFEP